LFKFEILLKGIYTTAPQFDRSV